jgi:IPT/TIG domain
MQKLKLFGLFAALTVVLVACPPTPPVTPPAPPPVTTPPPPTTPPTLPPTTALTVQGTLEAYTRGVHTLKFQVSSLAPTYAQTSVAEGQLAEDGKFQITLPDESKLSSLLQPFSVCPGVTAPSGLQTSSSGSMLAFSSKPISTGYLMLATQAPVSGVSPPPGTFQTIYIYADRDADVTGTCGSTVYDLKFKKGWNLIAAEFGQNSITRATTNVPANLKWFYVPTGGIVNVTAPATKLEIGKSYNFTATAQDSDGQPISGTPTWTSTDPANMPVSADGVVTPKGFTNGATISASLNGATGAINVQSYGLQIAGGTYNTGGASLGTAFLMRYLDETGKAPTTDRSFTVTGPGGWNGGAGLSVTYPANATSAWVARDDVAPVTGSYAFTTATAPAVSSLRAQSLGAATQSVQPSRSSITVLSPIPFTPGKVVASSNAISVTGTGFAIDATQSLGQATNITIGDYNGNYTTSSVTGNWTTPTVTPNFGQNTFEAQLLNTNGQVLGKLAGGFYGSGAASAVIAALSLESASSYEWRVLSFNTDTVNAYNYGVPVQFNVSRASKTFDFKPIITGLSFGGASTAGGPELVIAGKNFLNGATVKFGTTSATSVTVTPPNSINVIVPARTAGVVDVTVTTPAGTSTVSATTKFEYTTITEYALNATPILAAGPDGNLWFAETGGANSYPGITQVGKITPTGSVTRYPITTPSNATAYITDISAGPNNTVWFTEGYYNTARRIGKISTDGSGLAWYDLADSNSGAAALTTGSDSKIWFLENGGTRIGRIDANGANLTWFPVALGGSGTFSASFDMKLGPDGNVWFSAPGGRIGKVTVAGVVSVFTTSSNTYSFSPSGLTSGPNNLMWFTNGSGGFCCGGSGLGNVDTSGTITPVNPSTNPNVSVGTGARLAADASGNLWFGTNTYQATGTLPVVLGCCSATVSDIVFVGGRVWYARQDKTVGFITP